MNYFSSPMVPISIDNSKVLTSILVNTKTDGFITANPICELPLDILLPNRAQPKRFRMTIEFIGDDAERVYSIMSNLIEKQKKEQNG